MADGEEEKPWKKRLRQLREHHEQQEVRLCASKRRAPCARSGCASSLGTARHPSRATDSPHGIYSITSHYLQPLTAGAEGGGRGGGHATAGAAEAARGGRPANRGAAADRQLVPQHLPGGGRGARRQHRALELWWAAVRVNCSSHVCCLAGWQFCARLHCAARPAPEPRITSDPRLSSCAPPAYPPPFQASQTAPPQVSSSQSFPSKRHILTWAHQ